MRFSVEETASTDDLFTNKADRMFVDQHCPSIAALCHNMQDMQETQTAMCSADHIVGVNMKFSILRNEASPTDSLLIAQVYTPMHMRACLEEAYMLLSGHLVLPRLSTADNKNGDATSSAEASLGDDIPDDAPKTPDIAQNHTAQAKILPGGEYKDKDKDNDKDNDKEQQQQQQPGQPLQERIEKQGGESKGRDALEDQAPSSGTRVGIKPSKKNEGTHHNAGSECGRAFTRDARAWPFGTNRQSRNCDPVPSSRVGGDLIECLPYVGERGIEEDVYSAVSLCMSCAVATCVEDIGIYKRPGFDRLFEAVREARPDMTPLRLARYGRPQTGVAHPIERYNPKLVDVVAKADMGPCDSILATHKHKCERCVIDRAWRVLMLRISERHLVPHNAEVIRIVVRQLLNVQLCACACDDDSSSSSSSLIRDSLEAARKATNASVGTSSDRRTCTCPYVVVPSPAAAIAVARCQRGRRRDGDDASAVRDRGMPRHFRVSVAMPQIQVLYVDTRSHPLSKFLATDCPFFDMLSFDRIVPFGMSRSTYEAGSAPLSLARADACYNEQGHHCDHQPVANDGNPNGAIALRDEEEKANHWNAHQRLPFPSCASHLSGCVSLLHESADDWMTKTFPAFYLGDLKKWFAIISRMPLPHSLSRQPAEVV